MVWWDADHVRELLDSNHIDKYGLSSDTRLLTATGCSSNNGTKSTPALSADILGDWREEVIWRTSDNQYLRIYTTTTPATDRIYTLMHDPQYRESIAWQNTAYNQPPHTSFYLGDGMAPPPTPNIVYVNSNPATIAGRMIFYNNSKFDAHSGYTNGDPSANLYDDNAIATDKEALLPGHTATLANYTSFSRGINGIMIDILGLANPSGLNATDFQFKVGNGAGWTTAPQPASVSVRQGGGTGGSDRVTITWDDIAGNSIKNQWLQVTVKAGGNTGLSRRGCILFRQRRRRIGQ